MLMIPPDENIVVTRVVVTGCITTALALSPCDFSVIGEGFPISGSNFSCFPASSGLSFRHETADRGRGPGGRVGGGGGMRDVQGAFDSVRLEELLERAVPPQVREHVAA